MFGRGKVFEVRSTVIEGVVVFVVAFVAGGRVHDFTVHPDVIRLAVSDYSTHRVKAVLRADQPPVITSDSLVVVFVNKGEATTSQWYELSEMCCWFGLSFYEHFQPQLLEVGLGFQMLFW
jgi:hypothetical protein